MTKYVSEVMCSTYGGLEVEDHMIKNKNDGLCTKELEQVSDQKLRNMRHKTKCSEEKGYISTCKECDSSFSVDDILTHSFDKWKFRDLEIVPSTVSFPLSKERLDVYAMNYPYQVKTRNRSNPSQIDKMNGCFVKL